MTKLIVVSFIWIAFTFLIICIGDLVASSSASAGCQSRPCSLSQSQTGASSPFPKYEEGQSYYYEYETESITQLINSDNEDQSKVNLKGHVILTPITNCYFDLSVGALKAITWFRGAQANVNTKVDIPKSSLRFFLENGTIGQVCSQTGDSFWSQNIKKSIISLLQTTHSGDGIDDFKTTQVQNDISGSCETEVEKVGNLYFKKKDLNKCSHRELGPSFLQGVPYDSHGSKYNGIPLLESKLTCRQEIHSDVIQTSVCSEENVLKSFPASGSGTGSGSGSGPNLTPSIKSTLKSSLSLISVRRDFTPQASPSNFTPTTIYFQSGHQEGIATGVKPDSIQKLTLVLNFLCLEFKAEELSKDAPDHLQRLQRIFVTAPKEDLRQVYEDISAGHLCREKQTKIERVFLKAAAQSASDGSIGFLAELYTARELNNEIAALFFKHASFSRRPGRASLSIFNNLIQGSVNEENQMSILLSASAMGHQFCKLTNPNCGGVQEYTDLVDSLAQLTLARCENPREISKNTVLALQALGNLDHLTVKGVEAISKCLSVKSSRIKIHAFASFRRDPCQPFLKAKAKSILSNLRAGSDVRIHAFLALMRCFKHDDLEAIQRAVDVEQSNQVSSFIFSHLKNQLESRSRGKQGLKSLLRKIHIRPQAHGIPGKLSKSLESSWFLKENNVGFSLENNLVYSQDSYIPRTVSFNCTLDLLGRSYNFFEVGVYAENFENLLTRFYTEKVRFQTPSSDQNQNLHNATTLSETGDGDQVEDALDIDMEFDPYVDSDNNNESINNEISKSQNHSTEQNSNNSSNNNSIRNYIIKPADVEFIENQVQIEKRYGDNGEFDIFTRHHGTTISMSSMTQNDIPNLSEIPSILMAQKESFINFFKDQIIEKTRPINFIDEHIMIATSNGLPLNLKLHSSAIFSSKYEINVDLLALFSRSGSHRNGSSSSSSQVEEMHLRLMPNIAASINARMSVGPELFEAGYQLEGKLHLSAAADFSLENKIDHLKVNYNFPLNRFRVFEFDTQLVWVQEVNGFVSKRVEIQSRSPTQMLVNDCSTDSSRLFGFISPHQFGVRYCYNIRLPRGISFQNFWLQGPMSFRISSEKLDETMRGFSLDIHNVHDVDAEGKSATVIVLDASGEDTSRKITLVSNFTDSLGPGYGINVLEQFSANVEFPEAPLNFIAQIHDTNDDVTNETIQGITATLAMERQGSLSEFEYKIILKTTKDKDGSFNVDGTQNNLKQIVTYEPKISKRDLNSNTAAKHFLQGKLVRQVGSSLDFDVSVRLDSEALNLNSIDAKGLILANRSTGGNFEFQIKNGKLNTANSENNVISTEFSGKIFNENPNMGFELESVSKAEGTHENENRQELDFKIASSTSFIPAKKFSFETKVLSRKQPELNTDFKFLAELLKANVSKPGGSGGRVGASVGGTALEFEIESQIWIATHFNRWWDIEAVRRAGSTYGSLELTVDIPTFRRKLVLYTHRDHVDLDNFTKFDFDAFLKWNAGRDEKMKMALKLNFIKNDTSPESSIIKSKNEITFINQIHLINLNSKIPKNYTNGEYLIEADYTSPSGTNYGINYQKSITSNPRNSNYNNVSSEINVSVNIPQYPTIKGYWKHSLYLAKNAHLWNRDYELKNDLSVVAGRDTFFECILNVAERFSPGVSDEFSIANEFKFGGHFVPLQLHTFTKLDRFENGTIDFEFKLVNDYKSGDDDNNQIESRGPRMLVGEKGGQLIFKFRPEILVTSDEMLYRVELGWEPTRNYGGEYFILVPVKLSYRATTSMVSLFDFKIKNHAVLTLPSGETSFVKNIEFSNNSLNVETSLHTLNPDNVLAALNLNGALRKDGVGTFKLSTHTPVLEFIDAQFIAKFDYRNPQNYLNVSVNAGEDTLFTLDHQVVRSAPNRAAQNQRMTSQSRTFLQVNLFNTIFERTFEENQVTILHEVIWGQDRASFSLDYNLLGTKLRAKAGLLKDTDANPDSQNDKNQWFIILGYELQESSQSNDSYKIRFKGPISYNMETSAFKGIVLLEEFTYAHQDLSTEHSVTKIDGSLSSGIGLSLPTITSLYLNSTWFSADDTYFKYDKFQEYFESPNSVFQIDKELTETFIESLLTEPSGSNFIKYDYNVSHMTSSGSEVYYRLQVESFYPIGLPYLDLNLHLVTHEYALEKLTFLMLTNEELGQNWEIDDDSQDQDQGQGQGQIMTGYQWINTNSAPGQKFTSLCHIDEITLVPYPGPIQTGFQNCYTGFVLNRTTTNEGAALGEEKVLNAKFSFRGDIAFEAVKFEKLNFVEFNSSFWLDALDKPDEKLELSLLRKTVVESNAPNSVPNKIGREYLVAVKHPFLPKDLQVKTEFNRDHTGNTPILNVAVILDIFQEDAQSLAFNFQRKPQETGKDASDIEHDYDEEYDLSERIASTATSTAAVPEIFEISLVSEGLDLNMKLEGNIDLSDLSYNYVDRHGQPNEGKIRFRTFSLLDSTVAQIGELPFISVSFGGVPRLEISSPNSQNKSLILEYHGSPTSLRIFTSESPEDSYYSVVIPPRDEDEFTIGIYSQNNSDSDDISNTRVVNLDLALNTSNFFQIHSQWDTQQIQYALIDLRSLRKGIASSIKTYLTSATKEITANIKSYNSKMYNNIPETQKIFGKLKTELQNIYEDSMNWDTVHDSLQRALSIGGSTAFDFNGTGTVTVTAFSNFLQNLGGMSFDDFETNFEAAFQKCQEESISFILLSVGKIKRTWADSKIFLSQFLRAHPGLRNFLETFEEFITAGKTITRNLLRKLLYETIKIRPYLRWLIPKEAHEFLITLKNYSLDKLQSDNHIIIQNSIEITNVTSDEVLSKGFNAGKIIGRRFLESKGFLLQRENESILVQFPLPEPARTIRQVFSKRDKIPKADLHDLHNIYKWITDYDFKIPGMPNILQGINSALKGAVGLVGSTGVIIGGKFYRTFDGKMHRFEGSCQYLLAADFLERNLTLATDTDESNENEERRLVLMYNGETIAIYPNTSVEYEGHREKVSIINDFADFETTNLGPFRTYRQYFPLLGNGVSVFTRNSGLTVTCLTTFHVCFVRLEGHLYGKSLGLLGSNNLEHYDDFSAPNGEIVGKTGRFYRSWRLNRECKETKGNVLVADADESDRGEIKARCADIFQKDTSPLRSCFNTLNPVDFQDLCEALALSSKDENPDNSKNNSSSTDPIANQMFNTDDKVTAAVCTAASAYYMQCREYWIKVDFPLQCLLNQNQIPLSI